MTDARTVALEALKAGRTEQAIAAALVAIVGEIVRLHHDVDLLAHHVGIIARNLDDWQAGRP